MELEERERPPLSPDFNRAQRFNRRNLETTAAGSPNIHRRCEYRLTGDRFIRLTPSCRSHLYNRKRTFSQTQTSTYMSAKMRKTRIAGGERSTC
ncbi:hypothetical protein GC101_34685 [Paenibacillus sp. LMG 31459]|uniref:Uncharacterized protein n=1 Tax=Paenibacillus phytohabitans TaxID=2654978 RepID=A0ABX1YW99_9BACL|nr:hypothetical protein [Paenibacillus phytohabitans]